MRPPLTQTSMCYPLLLATGIGLHGFSRDDHVADDAACLQVSYMILQRVSPVTHSIGNCLKRVIVIVASVLVFHNPMSQQNMIGASLAAAHLPTSVPTMCKPHSNACLKLSVVSPTCEVERYRD